ncbi:MAG: hypothetical protein LLG40_13265 [Deltaproteobacteria bacterium]|nr:hypothetical protein [Deltaproteobacteria bacterium]
MLTNLDMVRGDTFTRTIEFTENGSSLNITGWTVFFTLKQNWQLPDSEASLQKIITNHTDPTNGKTVLELLPADTVTLNPGEFDYDIQALTDDNEVFTLLRGKFTIEYDVTRGTAGIAGT